MTTSHFVSAERANCAAATLCRVIGASISGLYAWLHAILAVQSRAVAEAELGLPDRRVRAWLRWAEGRTAAGSGAPVPTPTKEPAVPARRGGPSPADQAAEVGRLRREPDRVRRERGILGKAALIFGKARGRR